MGKRWALRRDNHQATAEEASDVEGMKIGEVAEQTGLSIRTIRHYDELGVVAPSGRSPGGFRLYSPTDVDRLLLIRRMKPLDFTLEEIREFLRATDLVAAAGSPTAETSPAENSEEITAARAAIAHIRKETGTRLQKLRRRVAYAEEFMQLLDTLGSGE